MAPANPSDRRSSGPFRFAAIAAVLAIGVTGCSIDPSDLLPGGGSEEPEESPGPVEAAPLFEEALEGLSAAPAITAQGEVGAPDGSEAKDASFTVTDSGATTGTVQEGENEAQVREADNKLFIQAPDEYWLGQGTFNPDSDKYGGNWVRVTGSQLGIDPASVLTPADLSTALEQLAPDSGEATPENLDGTSAYRIDLSGEENRVWVTEEEPHQLLRIEIAELVPEEGDSGPRVQLNLSEAETADVEKVYDDLLTWAEDDVSGSRDSRLEVAWDGQLDMECATGGECTVTGTVADQSTGDASGKVQVRMDATFTNDELGDKECDDTTSLEAGSKADLSCSVDYNLAPSSTPREYEVGGEGVLSTRGLSGKAGDKLAETIESQRDSTLEGGEEEPSEEESEDESE
ncbi:hypothetical protein F4561_004375 [Lipingzhangella halophila]|uniref:Uncharacterized protein n=1 Tax=Lipingzhangella halophila TaxID=1783352 RepID=A0A7W7W5A6_9ACTN|nr:hypothetical protein [Lipingzhangella halophila]MBB4933555.1 hypothetical protein [Lipingzhangella halophila]